MTLLCATPGKLQHSGTNLLYWMSRLVIIASLFVQRQSTKQTSLLQYSGLCRYPTLCTLYQVSYYRRCDSRNLNQSPLCNVLNPDIPAAWEPWVRDIYQEYGQVPDYVESIQGVYRDYYSNNYLKDYEIISSLTRVEVFSIYLW